MRPLPSILSNTLGYLLPAAPFNHTIPMNQTSHQPQPGQGFAIALPCAPEDFAGFIGSLLGKPQTIENSARGAFELRKDDITNSYHLVVQRIAQQNDAHLLQFTVRLVFDDNSSVLLNSLADFIAYSEVRPVYPTQAHLSWSFIVKFQDRQHPEKQDIDLSFITGASAAVSIGSGADVAVVSMQRISLGGFITFRIRHTARTWGADIEGLLTGHAEHLLLPESPVRKAARTHSGKIALFVAFAFFVTTIAGCLFTANHLAIEQLKLVSGLMQTSAALDVKVNRLLEMTAEGFWGKYFFSVLVFVIFSFLASIGLGVWAESSADAIRPSYLLLTKKAEQVKIEKDGRYRVKWFSFIGSLAFAIFAGIASNIIFTRYWGA